MKKKLKLDISEEYIRKLFGVNLKKSLIDSELSQQDLAAMIGTSPLVVTRWCNGYAIPQPRMLAGICNAIGVRPQELMRERAS